MLNVMKSQDRKTGRSRTCLGQISPQNQRRRKNTVLKVRIVNQDFFALCTIKQTSPLNSH